MMILFVRCALIFLLLPFQKQIKIDQLKCDLNFFISSISVCLQFGISEDSYPLRLKILLTIIRKVRCIKFSGG